MSVSYFVHPSSVIDQGARIGADTSIWHFCHIRGTGIIGDNCILGQNVYIDTNVTIGNRVKIQNNVSVYNGVTIEDDVFLGPSVVFTNVINPRSFIERKDSLLKTTVRKGATIGANATIICGIEIGIYAMIGAGAVVTKDVLPYAIMKGNPARHTGWVSEAGFALVFDKENKARCPFNNEVYELKENGIIKI